MTPCQKLLKQEGTARRSESMQQSSATPSLHLWFLGVAEDCCMLSILLAVPSCFNSFLARCHPYNHATSFLIIFILVILWHHSCGDVAIIILTHMACHMSAPSLHNDSILDITCMFTLPWLLCMFTCHRTGLLRQRWC